MRTTRGFIGMASAALVAGLALMPSGPSVTATASPKPKRSRYRPGGVAYGGGMVRRYGITYEPNGERECQRRMRQIVAGSLRAENGLVAP